MSKKRIRASAVPPQRRIALAVAVALLPWVWAQPAAADPASNQLPTGGQVTSGTANISTTGSKMQIDQATSKAILNWQSFSIGSNGWVNFSQPSASSIALNKVLGNNPSEIFGRLSANGQVFLSNPSGVLFAPSASVDVGSLFATSLSINDQDFLAGRYNFYNAGNAGSVVNQGTIIATSGYAALAGPQVRNDGVIIAQAGTVTLAAGDRVTLDMVGDGLISVSVDAAALNASAINTGTIQADGGRVLLTARSANALLDTVINNTGIIRANSLVERNGEIILDGGSAGVVSNSGTLQAAGVDAGTTGGTVKVLGQYVGLFDGTRIDASGDAGGGTVLVGGNFHGAGPEQNATGAFIGSDASIRADATQSGDGGQVIVWSKDATRVYGAVSARGAGDGKGGFVETSGGYLEVTQAPDVGAGGTWLIDPYNIEVVAGAGTVNNDGTPTFTPNGENSHIGADLITGQLDAGTSVVLDTGVPGTQAGDIAVNANIFVGFSSGPASLTLNAANDIQVNGGIILPGGGDLRFTAGRDMTVRNQVYSNGRLDVALGRDLKVLSTDPVGAFLIAWKGQTITAESVAVTAQNGGSASIMNSGGDQTIAVSGDGASGGVDVQVLSGGGFAQIGNSSPGGRQIVAVSNADHINVNGAGNTAAIFTVGGTQTISITGSGANAITIGSTGALGSSNLGGGIVQNVTAGLPGESGSITIMGPAVNNAGARLYTNASLGGTQTIATSGLIDVTGGTAPNSAFASGIFHQGSGAQTISAAGISLTGGPSGSNNIAQVGSFGGGVPANAGNEIIHVAGGVITLRGSDTGINNRAQIFSNADQTIDGNPDLILTGGASALPLTGSATIGTAAGRSQTIHAGNITLQNSPVGVIDSVAGINSSHQAITATGDVTLSSGGLGTVRIGGPGGAAATPTDLTLNVGGNLVLTGGNAGFGVGIGSFATGATAFANNINIAAAGDVVLNAGAGSDARIGSAAATGTAGGNISVSGRSIQLNGAGASTTIRTLDSVVLHADQPGGTISEVGNGFIVAGALNTTSSGNTSLVGPNHVSSFNGLSGGDLSLANTGALNVTGLNAGGNATLSNVGNVTLSGPWTAGGTSSITVASDIVLDALLSSTNVVLNTDGGTITEASGGSIVANSLATTSSGSTTLGGANHLSSFNASSGGAVSLNNAGELDVTGLNAAGSATVTNAGAVTVSGDIATANGAITLTANSLTNHATITNGGGANNSVTILAANAFDLGGGTVNNGAGVVAVRPRTATNSFGIEDASRATSLTNADLASINTTDFVVLGSGMFSNFTGNMSIGVDHQVNGGAKHLGFFRSFLSPGTISIGANGLTTSGNVIVAGGGSIVGTGTVGGNQVEMRVTNGIGAPGVRVGTAANTLAANSTSGGVFIAEADDVTLNTVVLIAGGNINTATNTAGSGGAYDLTANGTVTVSGPVSSGQMNFNVLGGLNLIAGGTQDATLTSVGGQTISAQSLAMTAQDARRAVISNNGGNQSISIGAGGMDLNVVAGAGVAQIVNNAGSGTQTVTTTGTLNVVGGSALPSTGSGVFQNQSGKQTVTAANITLQGATTGNSGAAFIINTGGGGDQEINVAGGTISLTGGAVGFGNRAGIVTNGNQTINGNPNIVLTGGASGGGTAAALTSNGAFFSANGIGKVQTINAANITLTGGSGGTDTFASIGGANQVIAATGDVLLTGGAGTGDAPIARIGGVGGSPSSPTNLTLSARDVILTGGSGAAGDAGLGSTVIGVAQPNTITVNATRDVILNSGTGAGARIGSSSINGTAGGNITVIAGGNIELNGTAQPTAIRTTGNVTLSAGAPGGMSEGSNGFIQADSLSTTSMGPVALTGPNQVGTLNVLTYGGDLSFNNSGALNLAQVVTTSNLLGAGNAVITNTGDVSVTNSVNTSGTLTMNVAGALKLDADATHDAFVTSNGQTINAQSLSVSSRDGRVATLRSNADQTISIAGGSVDIQLLAPTGSAQVSSSGNQSMTVTDGDHIAVNGGGIFSSANQTLSITGSGANRISVGGAGTPRGSAVVAGRNQTVTAGTDGQSGSIAITGPASAGTGISGFVTSAGVGTETQSISTTGTLRVTGGTAPAQVPNLNSGIFHNRQGRQTITAADVFVEGGASGSNNSAFIATNGPAPNGAGPGGGDQVIHVAGTITLRGSDGGFNNRASIFSNANQTIDGNPDLILTGGASATPLTASAAIQTAPGRSQTIYAGNITLQNSPAGVIDSFAGINSGHQLITATGDVTLSSGGVGTVRIGGPGGVAAAPTDLTLNVGGNLVLTGGSAGFGVGIGSFPTGATAFANNITIAAAGDVVLNAGAGSDARIGSAAASGTAGGNISVSGRSIQLNGAGAPAAIRTLDNVVLHADQPGGAISETGNGFVIAGSLTTTSSGSTSLTGPNQVSSFNGSSGTGDVSLTNTSALLTVSSLTARDVVLNQAGDLAVTGNVVASGAETINATGGITMAADTTPIEVRAGGPISMTVGNDLRLAGGAGADAHALVFSGSDIFLTIGGAVRLNAGSGENSWARIQTATRDSVINIYFPNLSSGGYFVNDIEGALRRGQTGFLSGMGVAAPGQEFITTYGLE